MPVGLGRCRIPSHQHGNPHATFFVADAAAIPLEELGPKLEHDASFRARQYRRGRAGGRGKAPAARLGARRRPEPGLRSGACAALVAASRPRLVRRQAEVILDAARSRRMLRDGT